jgi:hypothetical protein
MAPIQYMAFRGSAHSFSQSRTRPRVRSKKQTAIASMRASIASRLRWKGVKKSRDRAVRMVSRIAGAASRSRKDAARGGPTAAVTSCSLSAAEIERGGCGTCTGDPWPGKGTACGSPTGAKERAAPEHLLIYVVRASGEISVRAQLVRPHIDISPSPIRAYRALKGDDSALTPRTALSLPFPSIGARTAPRNRKYLSIGGVTTGPISVGPPEMPMP